MTPAFTMVSTIASMVSVPHLAAVTLPVVALLSRSRSTSVSSTGSNTPKASPAAAPHITLWKAGALEEFVVDSEPTQHVGSEASLALSSSSLATRLTNAVRDWRSLLTIQMDTLVEAHEMQVEDDGDEADWYAHTHDAPAVTRARSTSRACGSPCSSTANRLSSRARSSSNLSNRRRSCSKTVSPEELGKRLISLEANAPRTCILLSPPPPRRRRAA